MYNLWWHVNDSIAELRDILWKSMGYVPSYAQEPAHNSNARITLMSGGERSGKSFSTAKQALWWIVTFAQIISKEIGGKLVYSDLHKMLGWLVGPTYELCRVEFEYLFNDLAELGMIDPKRDVSYPKQGPCSINLPFGVVETKSADDAMKIAAKAPHWILVCEVAQLDYYSFSKTLGRAAQNRAPVWASGTLEESNLWFPRLLEDWQIEGNPEGGRSFFVPTWSNLTIFPGGREDPEIKRFESMWEHSFFMERFGAIPRKPANLVFPQFDYLKHVMPMRLGKDFEYLGPEDGVILPFESEWELCIDPGYAGAYAVLASQIIDGRVYVYDEVVEQYKTAREVIAKCKEQVWWPHVKRGVIDVAGRQHHGTESQIEIWAAEAGLHLSSRNVPISAGIERYRSFLSSGEAGLARVFYNKECTNSISEHNLYKYRNPKEGRPINELPIDANNHCVLAGSMVMTPQGKTKIDNLIYAKEFYVYCWIDGMVQQRRAHSVSRRPLSGKIIEIDTGIDKVSMTEDHLVLLSGGRYVMAKDLVLGDRLVLGQKIIDINTFASKRNIVYNLEVDEAENFIANGVVVHNCLKAVAYYLVDRFGFVETPERNRLIWELPFSKRNDRFGRTEVWWER